MNQTIHNPDGDKSVGIHVGNAMIDLYIVALFTNPISSRTS